MCTVLHQITLCFFLLNPCQSQSGPPGQIMRAGSLITADISLAKFRWNVGVFSQTFRSHKNLDCSTLSHISEVKQSHSWILKNKTSEQGGKHRRGTHTHTAGSWVQFQAVFGVCGTGSLCKTNRPRAGNTRPDPGTVASCHTFHTPTIKIPERIRPQRYIQPSTRSCSFPPSALQHSHLSTALTHSSTTARAPTLTQWERRRRLRTRRPHYSDGKEWYITSASKPRQRYIARFFPEKGHCIRGEHLGVNVVVNHEGLRTETGAWKDPAGGPVDTSFLWRRIQ